MYFATPSSRKGKSPSGDIFQAILASGITAFKMRLWKTTMLLALISRSAQVTVRDGVDPPSKSSKTPSLLNM
jgi:hypothetical protein